MRKMCCKIALGDSLPNVLLPASPAAGTPGSTQLLSTVTITVLNPADTVRLVASIWSETTSSVITGPLHGNVVVFQIVRADNSIVREVADTDFDEMTTEFTAFDNPGAGTHTYRLLAFVLRNTVPQGELVLNNVFTAEELSPAT